MKLITAILTGAMLLTATAEIQGLSVFHVHLVEMARQRGVPLKTAAEAVKSWGIDGVDLWYDHHESAGEELLSYGLKPATVIAFMDLAGTNDTGRADRIIAYTRRIGSPRIMLVPGFFPKEVSRDAAWRTAKPRLADFLARAAKAGLEVNFEDFDSERVLVGSQAHVRDALADFPSLGHVLDTGNYLFWHDDVLSACDEFLPRIRHVHLKDRDKNAPVKSVAAGTGSIPMREILRRLKRGGYAGWLTLECFGSTNMWEDIRRSAKNVRAALGANAACAEAGDYGLVESDLLQTAAEAEYDFVAGELDRVHREGMRDADAKPAPGEFVFSDGMAVGDEDFADYLKTSMGVKVCAARCAAPTTVGADVRDSPAVTAVISPVAKGYTVEVTAKGVKIVASDEFQKHQAYYHLEDLMNLRGGPFLKIGKETRSPKFEHRMIHSGLYNRRISERYLENMRHHGFDTLLLCVNLRDVKAGANIVEGQLHFQRHNAAADEATKTAEKAEIFRLARLEYDNAKKTVPLLEADSRLGFARPMKYKGGLKPLRFKLKAMEKLYDL